MAESAQYINSLVETSPGGDDYKYDGAAQMRVIKSALKNTFPSINGAMTVTDEELNALSGVASNVQTQINNLSATFSTMTTRMNNLSATVSANQILISAIKLYHLQNRHFASIGIKDELTYTIGNSIVLMLPMRTIAESTAIVRSVTSLPVGWQSLTDGKEFLTPNGKTRARIYGCKSYDYGVSVNTEPTIVIYNTFTSTDYYYYFNDAPRSQFKSNSFTVRKFSQTIELTTTSGSTILVGIVNDPGIDNSFRFEYTAAAGTWFGVEYR